VPIQWCYCEIAQPYQRGILPTDGIVDTPDMLVHGTSAMALSAAPAIILPRKGSAGRKTLKILQWNHFVPACDDWFNNAYIKERGEKNDTQVIVDNVGMSSLNGRAQAG